MLKLSEDIFNANQERILQAVCELYNLNRDDLKKLGSFESFVYECNHKPQPIIIKITHDRHRSMNQIRAELEWARHLHKHDVSVCEVVSSSNSQDVEEIAIEGSSFFVYAFEKAMGGFCSYSDWTDNFVAEWGRVLGRMHAASITYRPSQDTLKRHDWRDDSERFLREFNLPANQGIAAKFREMLAEIEKLPQTKESYGLIHSDLHYGNFLVNDGRITVIDTDDCHYNWFAFDLSIPLYYVLRDSHIDPDDSVFAEKFFANLLRGYCYEYKIEKWWLEALPLFLKLREIDLYLILKTEGQPVLNDWCQRLLEGRRERIENDVPVIDLDFTEFA